LVYLSAWVQNDGLGCTALSGASCVRQKDTATSDSEKKESRLLLATQTTRPNASVPVRGLTLQTLQPQSMDDVARDSYVPAASLLSYSIYRLNACET